MKNVEDILHRLEIIRDNFTDIGNLNKEKLYIGNVCINPEYGVCSNARLDKLPMHLHDRMIESWDEAEVYDNNEIMYAYPVGGRSEYYRYWSTNKNMYTNPKRLRFTEHCIEFIQKNRDEINRWLA